MSTLKRFDLLVPCLDRLDGAWPHGDDCIDVNDVYTVRQAFKVWITITSDILFNRGYSTSSIDARLQKLVTELLKTHTPSKWLTASKIAYDLLIDLVSLKRPIVDNFYVDFKGQLAVSLNDTVLSDALVAPIARILSSISGVYLRENGCWRSHDSNAICDCAQYFGFLMKLELTRPDLEERALADYIQFEENYFKFDAAANPYALPLKRIILRWLEDFRYEGKGCRHGNGSVANATRAKLDKYRNFGTDLRLNYLFFRSEQVDLAGYDFLSNHGQLDRCSRLQFVPKNISKLRSISMEPVALQFVQQGVMKRLYSYIAQHPYLSKHIKLEDQEQNKSYAYDGSITDNFSTIDLSAASDSVSYDLVKYLFSGKTELWRWLLGTRSESTLLPNGERIKLKKFAPMGSAVCFPVETLIFAAVAELAVSLGRERGLTQDVSSGIYNSYYTVYGDDIIVPRGVYSLTCDILHSFGFSINRAKSYDSSPFKESCGGNYHCGRDITPIKWKINLNKDGSLNAENYSAICTVINSLYLKELKVTRCYLIKFIKEKGYTPLFTDRIDQSPAIYSPTPTNFHCKSRLRRDLQCYEITYTNVKTSLLKPICAKDKEQIETIMYLTWLHEHQEKGVPGQKQLFQETHKGSRIFAFNEDPPMSPKSFLLTKVVKGKGRYLSYSRECNSTTS